MRDISGISTVSHDIQHDIQRATLVWGLLLFLTLCNFYLSARLNGVPLMTAVLALAIVKAGWIAFDYMGLRHTRLAWRLVMSLWLTLVATGIAVAYLFPA